MGKLESIAAALLESLRNAGIPAALTGGIAANAWVEKSDLRPTYDVDAAILAPEDVVLYKSLARREKDRIMIAAIAKAQNLDRRYIERWARKLGVWGFASRALRE